MRAVRPFVLLGLAALACAASAVRVALLPVVNASGFQWEDLKARQVNDCNDYLHEQFVEHGLELIPVNRVMHEMRAEGLTLNDDDPRRQDALVKLGKALGADFVVLAVITDTEATKDSHVVFTDAVGHATAQMWLVDAKTGQVSMSGKRFSEESGGTRLSYDNKGSDRQVQAAVNAVRDGVAEFLAKFPVVKPRK
jgi:hypothetical protein